MKNIYNVYTILRPLLIEEAIIYRKNVFTYFKNNTNLLHIFSRLILF